MITRDETDHTQIGKKYYEQKTGIPQGSVLSSILCNFFYADLEREKLSFIAADGDSLLLRLIDDFLLISLDRTKATRFLKVMVDGNPDYGAKVNADKSLVNFETAINGRKIPRLVGTREFPYCGTVIDTQKLDVRRGRERRGGASISPSLPPAPPTQLTVTRHRRYPDCRILPTPRQHTLT